MRRTKEGWDPPFFLCHERCIAPPVKPSRSAASGCAKLSAILDQAMLRMKNPTLQRIWTILTWRWRMQIALNAPFALLWIADKTNPAVHAFNMTALSAMHAEWLAPMIGIA